MASIQTANQAINSKMMAPNNQVITLVENAELAIKDMTDKINDFFSTKWTSYRQQVEETKINLFKDYKPIE
jgi:hypothetical protein